MLSGALAGILRVGAVVLTAGGLAGGVYFLVQVGEEETSRLQAEATATLSAPPPLSPPSEVTAPPTATPTFSPAPITPPAIDTSDWLTYTSPLGFTIKYPPGWAVVEQDYSLSPLDAQIAEAAGIPTPSPGHAKIFNETVQAERALRDPAEPGATWYSGAAWIEIAPISHPPRFDADELFGLCGPQDEPVPASGLSSRASELTFGGLPAVLCVQEGPTPDGQHSINVELYWVGLPSGRVIHIAAYAVDGEDATFTLLRAILSTPSFEAAP